MGESRTFVLVQIVSHNTTGVLICNTIFYTFTIKIRNLRSIPFVFKNNQ